MGSLRRGLHSEVQSRGHRSARSCTTLLWAHRWIYWSGWIGVASLRTGAAVATWIGASAGAPLRSRLSGTHSASSK